MKAKAIFTELLLYPLIQENSWPKCQKKDQNALKTFYGALWRTLGSFSPHLPRIVVENNVAWDRICSHYSLIRTIETMVSQEMQPTSSVQVVLPAFDSAELAKTAIDGRQTVRIKVKFSDKRVCARQTTVQSVLHLFLGAQLVQGVGSSRQQPVLDRQALM